MNFAAKMLRDGALEGKTIVITGGGSGLGKAMTKYFMELFYPNKHLLLHFHIGRS